MDVSVIICAYTLERFELLRRAVDGVRAQTHQPRETIVVVDGNEELRERAAAELGGAVVIANEHGHGSSGARQTGAERASSPILAYLDDDAVPEPQWLEEMMAAFVDPRALGAGGAIEPLWETARPRWLAPELDWVIGCTYAGMPVRDGRIRNPISANMTVRASVVATAGSMDPRLTRLARGSTVTGTAEETEFCIRAARLHPGGYWAYRPGARVHHTVPAARTTWPYFVARCRLEAAAKAVLTELTGTGDGLSSERAYTFTVLPRAVVRELAAAVRGDLGGLQRAGAIIVGLAVTGLAYAVERTRARTRTRDRTRDRTGADPADQNAQERSGPASAGSKIDAPPTSQNRFEA